LKSIEPSLNKRKRVLGEREIQLLEKKIQRRERERERIKWVGKIGKWGVNGKKMGASVV
jgi:hypothetical protein